MRGGGDRMQLRTTPCRACGRPIAFIRTPRGRYLPVDPDPVLTVRRGPGQVTIVTPRGEVIRGYETQEPQDRKSTRLNSSHVKNSYAVFCLKQKKTHAH